MKKSLGPGASVFPTPVFVVGTYDDSGKANVMTAAWAGICCSEPPCVAISLRKATDSYGCIVDRQCFTISVPSQSQVRDADYFGVASGKEEDKFAASGLTPTPSDKVNAPYVGEFPFVLECKLLHTFEIGLHTQFVGQILDIKADEAVLDEEGRLDIQKVRPIIFAPGTGAYYAIGDCLGKAFTIGKQ